MPYFCKLANPKDYRACDWDLLRDEEGRRCWLKVFRDHTTSLIEHARGSCHPPSERAIEAYEKAFFGVLDRLEAEPQAYGSLDIYKLCELRAELMCQFQIGDPYDKVKADENDLAIRHLPGWLQRLDEADDGDVVEMLLRGVLAGNKFDLGAKETTELHAAGGLDFHETLSTLPEHPWFMDDSEEVRGRLAPGKVGYKKAFYFVDNAGADVVLGAVPWARYLARQGCSVVLGANPEPALNDILVRELNSLLPRLGQTDAVLADQVSSGQLSVVSTGCDCPLIDLADVDHACNSAAADCDLVIIEGMGRAVETNFDAAFTCDVIHIAMIKNRYLARRLGCEMFDLIVRFTPAGKKPELPATLADLDARSSG